MDAVFGEGKYSDQLHATWQFISPPDKRDEEYENESERTSLVGGHVPTQQTLSPHPRSPRTGQRGWLSNMFNRSDGRARYEPIGPDAE